MAADAEHQQRSDIAKGAGMAFLGRAGAIVDVVGLPLLAWAYGAPNLGLFFTLAGVVKILQELGGFGMSSALQRFIPAAKSDAEAASILRTALVTCATCSGLMALAIALAAPFLASHVNAADADAPHLVHIIQIYALTLPLSAILDVATAAIRAQRKFGPEIRIRIFYEQALRIAFGLLFFWFGWSSYGLFLSHVVSLILACGLAVQLLNRHFSLSLAIATVPEMKMKRRMLMYGMPMMVTNSFRMFHSELPVLVLNLILPGAAGAVAAGLYGTGRKIVSALDLVRLSLEYVMAPLAAARAGDDTRCLLRDMIRFSTRLSLSIFIVGASFLILVRHDLLAVFKPEFAGAASVIVILSAGRMLQAMTGPSNAVIDMLGRFVEPVLYSGLGVVLMLVLQAVLAPAYGADGAAMAASAGLAATSLLCLFRQITALDLQPYSAAMIRPVAISLGLAGLQGLVSNMTDGLSAALHGGIQTAMLLVCLGILFRWGFSKSDRAAYARRQDNCPQG